MNRTHFVTMAAVLVGALAGCTPVTPSEINGEYTIRLMGAEGANHVQRINAYKEHTEQETGWTGLYVVIKGNFSELYWGKYPTEKAALGDLERAKNFRTHLGIQAFPKPVILPIPGSDTGPPEMNLANAKGVYTVLIATFHDDPARDYFGQYRRFAVENCKDLRQKGEEAYFYHAAGQSIVTIGCFDASAIKQVKVGSITTNEYNNDAIVRIIKRHPLMAENGYSMRVRLPTGPSTVKWVDKPSYAIRIPTDSDPGLFPSSTGEVKPATPPGNP